MISRSTVSSGYIHWALIALALAVAVGTFIARRAIVANLEAAGRQRYGQQIAEQLEQIRQERLVQQQRRQQQKALAELLAMLARNPSDTSLLIPIGSLMLQTGDTLGALSYYRRYVDTVNSSNVVALVDYAYLLYATGERQRGRQLTEQALRQAPEYQVALYNMAVMEYDRSNIESAIAWMRRCWLVDSSSTLGQLSAQAIQHLRQLRKQSQNSTN